MGNEVCCKDDLPKSQLPTNTLKSIKRTNTHIDKLKASNIKYEHLSSSSSLSLHHIQIPRLSQTIENHLARLKPLQDRLPTNPVIKIFGDQVYAGGLNLRGKPDGYGKMYRNNGSLFIGKFENGIANGIGHYVKPDGSYYHGNLRNNKADDENGFYWSSVFQYEGGIHDNAFNGEGSEIGENYEFNGRYKDGRKVQGVLAWRDIDAKYVYTGPFNHHGFFDGKGKLQQSNLGTYEGEFQNGQKHGHGEFHFLSGKKYIGQYYYGVKQGHGKTLNKDGVITYQGEWSDGLPHGRGLARNKQGEYVERIFVQGLDKQFLEDDD